MKEIQAKNQMNNRDDCSVFGKHVANKIRKMSNPRTQAAAQCNALFDAEMGKFHQPPRMYGQPHYNTVHTQYNDNFRKSSINPYDDPVPSTSAGCSSWQTTQQSQYSSLVRTSLSNIPSDDSDFTDDGTEDIDKILHSLYFIIQFVSKFYCTMVIKTYF